MSLFLKAGGAAAAPVIVGHRGAPGAAAENTPAAFAAALEAGATWVELDVRRARGGVLVVRHDAYTPDGRPVVEQGPDELRAKGVWRFDEVWAALPPALGVDIEFKNVPGEPDFDEDARAVGPLAEVVRRSVGTRPLLTSSFNPLVLPSLAAALPDVPVGLVHSAGLRLDAALGLALEFGAEVLCPNLQACGVDADGVAAVHDAGLEVLVWTVNEADQARQLAAAGVDAICTDDPAGLRAALDG